MKRFARFAGLLVTAVLLSTSFAVCFAQAAPKNDPREQLLKEWIEAARYVAEKTQDKQALEIMQFIDKHGISVLPVKEGVFFPGDTIKGIKNFGILVAIDGDEKVAEWLEKIINHPNVGASFNPDTKVVLVRGATKVSKIFKGIIMLHECYHAFRCINFPYDWRDVKTYCREERGAHEFQNRLTDILGGPEFVKFIDKEVESIKIPLGADLENQVVILEPKKLEVDRFFGPSQSQFEEAFRYSSMAIEINFKLFERKFKGDIEEKKAISLFKRYEEAGLLPDQED